MDGADRGWREPQNISARRSAEGPIGFLILPLVTNGSFRLCKVQDLTKTKMFAVLRHCTAADLNWTRLSQFLEAASTVRRIHSERVRSLLFAALVNCSASALVSRMGTILPLASPFGSFGLPGLRFFWTTTSESRENSLVLG